MSAMAVFRGAGVVSGRDKCSVFGACVTRRSSAVAGF